MKMKWIAIFAYSTVLISACGIKDKSVSELDNLYNKSGNTINISERNDHYNPRSALQNTDDQFGFVRQVKSPVPNETINIKPINLSDREAIANKISKITVTLPHVVDSSVLVTDQEILIAYQIDDNNDHVRFETADQVKKTAISLVPRWYHVYITDDPALRQDVKNIASMNAYSTEKDRTVRKTVKLMLERSPQGRKMNDSENANGETFGETNHELDQTNYRQQFENLK